jgi:hypothetical protein
MIRSILRYGIIAGLIVTIPMDLAMVFAHADSPFKGMVFGYLTMIVGLTAVFLGVKHYRDTVLGGAIKFGQALLVGLGISAVASFIYVLGWELTLALTDYQFVGAYSQSMVEAVRSRGGTDAEIKTAMADAAEFVTMYGNPVSRMGITFVEMFPVGILVSLISAALLRNSQLLPARAPA